MIDCRSLPCLAATAYNTITPTVEISDLQNPSWVAPACRKSRHASQSRHQAAIAPALRSAYRATHYLAYLPSGEVCIEIGQPSQAVSQWLLEVGRRSAVLLSAWNPMSRHLTAEDNAARHACLISRLQRKSFPFVNAIGQSPDCNWAEPGVLIAGVSKQGADRLAFDFDQAGYVLIGQSKPASLRIRTTRDKWVEDARLA